MAKKKQMVFIMTDTQRFDMCGCYKDTGLKTPCIDALAASGIRYERAYTTQPVCGPARAVIQTGLYATHNTCYRNAIDLPITDDTLAHRLDSVRHLLNNTIL